MAIAAGPLDVVVARVAIRHEVHVAVVILRRASLACQSDLLGTPKKLKVLNLADPRGPQFNLTATGI